MKPYLFFKRMLDIIGALLLLPIVIVLTVIIAPIIWLTDRGPIFYNAMRIGKGGKPFKMFKFRSMYVNSSDIRNADGSTYNSDYDPRVTPVGRILRKTSLDEFPQVLNVLIGDMSFVGPRPTVGTIDPDTFVGDRKKRYSVKPGITGYSQALFRNSISMEEKFRLDVYYVDNMSFPLDMRILWQTLISVIKRRNINHEQIMK